MQIVHSPRVTVLSRPLFLNPEHYPFIASNESAGQDLTEFAGRLCYMSFGDGEINGHKTVAGRSNTRAYFENIKKQKHGSVMEHANYSLLIEGVSRSLTHELVRHRAGFAYSQLSQRFVEPENIAFVLPPAIPLIQGDPNFDRWKNSCLEAELAYADLYDQMNKLRSIETKKQLREACRSVLPNSTETKIVVTANVRAWRHFLTKRGALGADAEIRRLALAVLIALKAEAPFLFDDVMEVVDENRRKYISVEYESV